MNNSLIREGRDVTMYFFKFLEFIVMVSERYSHALHIYIYIYILMSLIIIAPYIRRRHTAWAGLLMYHDNGKAG